MFFQSSSFKTLEAGVHMSWMQQQSHIQNLANIETPGYKSQRLEFQKILEKETANGTSVELKGQIVTDDHLSLRPDGNNVDFEKENIDLYKSYTQYSMFLDKVKGQFDNYSVVLNNSMK